MAHLPMEDPLRAALRTGTTRRATLFDGALSIFQMATCTLGRAINLSARDMVAVPITTLAADPARSRSNSLREVVKTGGECSGDELLGRDAALFDEAAAAQLLETAALADFFDARDLDPSGLLVSKTGRDGLHVLRWRLGTHMLCECFVFCMVVDMMNVVMLCERNWLKTGTCVMRNENDCIAWRL